MFEGPGGLFETHPDFSKVWELIAEFLVRNNSSMDSFAQLPEDDEFNNYLQEVFNAYAVHALFTLHGNNSFLLDRITDVNPIFRTRFINALDGAAKTCLLIA